MPVIQVNEFEGLSLCFLPTTVMLARPKLSYPNLTKRRFLLSCFSFLKNRIKVFFFVRAANVSSA